MSIIAFSDVHLGIPQCNTDDFFMFVLWLQDHPPDHLVILGDRVDFWRRSNAEVLLENQGVLNDLFAIKSDIHYVVGNHDYSVGDAFGIPAQKSMGIGYGRFSITKMLRTATTADKFVTFIHGYDLDVAVNMEGMPLGVYESFASLMCGANDTIGGFASLLWGGLMISPKHVPKMIQMRQSPAFRHFVGDKLYQIACSDQSPLLVGICPQDNFVFGHTHLPFISSNGRVANTGS
jgi:UDP-2,3-diacylglucosamine pyrophosphatase LpxH